MKILSPPPLKKALNKICIKSKHEISSKIPEFIQPNIYKKYSTSIATFLSSCSEGGSIGHLGNTKRRWGNFINSPASGAGKVCEPMLKPQVGRVREVVVRVERCVSAVRAVDVPVLVCLRSNSSHVTEVGGP
jgi:hypothetical protein